MDKKRKQLKKLVPYAFIIALLVLGYQLVLPRERDLAENTPITTELRGREPQKNIVNAEPELPKRTLLEVPFSPQAPFANWDDERQQDGCEEASLLMAARWAKGDTLALDEAEQEIFKMADYQNEKFGTFHDTSAADTKALAEEYFDLSNIDLHYDIGTEDIKKALAEGKLVLVPANGQKLNNKFFQQPGPERHFLVIRGYDEKYFITNDPGTKHGEGFKYAHSTLLNAIRDYPTGYKLPITTERKAMLVVGKEN
jgi:hypothetical protein